MALMAVTMLSVAQNSGDMTKHLPANWGGWVNLSYNVNDTTYYTSDLLPMQAAVSGKTLHVFWLDWKPNAQGEYSIWYRRSTDAGRTWEDARAIVKAKGLSMSDGNYLATCIGGNSKWYDVQGQNVRLATVINSGDGQEEELLYTWSTNGGKTFQQRAVAKGSDGAGYYNFYRPHVVSDGQTVVIAVQQAQYNNSDYRTRVLTSFDGGATFTDKLIDTVNQLGDVQVSGRRWALLGNHTDWYVGNGNVYLSTSTDGGETISTQNIAPILNDGRSWCGLNYMSGLNGQSWNYHPQMTLEGDVINVLFQGCIDKDEEHPGYNSNRAHAVFRRSTDGGKTWNDAMYVPGTNGSWGAIAAKGQHIYVLQTPNGPKVWHSHDGGKTWDVQERCYWSGRYDGYNNFFELYIAPDDATGQHVYMTGVRGLLVESKDGFRTVHRNFAIGTESWDYKNWNNNSLTVLIDSEGTEHWLMHYSSPYKPFESYFWNIAYRNNSVAPVVPNAPAAADMALDISKVVDQPIDRPMTNLTIPMTPSLMETQEATTVECWVRVDQGNSFQIACLNNNIPTHEGSRYYGGWYFDVASDYRDFFSFEGGVCTELSVDAVGKTIWDRWRFQNKEWGLWHHVALTYDSKVEKDNVRLYADGLLIGTATERGKLRIGNNPIVIGRDNNSYEPKGLVDNFAIYSRALTQEEIQQHLYNLPDANDKDCRLLLTFDGSLQDKSQYKNDPVPLMNCTLVEHNGIRAPHPDFTLTKDVTGQTIYLNDMTPDGVAYWWVKPDPWDLQNPGKYSTSQKRHEQQDARNHPGTYTYWLVAKGTGDYNACAAITKSIMIGGLSRVMPEVASRSDAVRLKIQGGYELTYNNQPRVVLHNEKGDIEGKWVMDKNFNYKNAQTIDDFPDASFDMILADAGRYDVIVGNDTLFNAFELKESEQPEVWVEISGRDKMLFNKYQKYSIDFGNTSNTAAYNTPLFLFISDKDGNLDLTFDFEVKYYGEDIPDAVKEICKEYENGVVINTPEYGPMRAYSLCIPYIAPHGEGHLSFRVRLNNGAGLSDYGIDMVYAVGQPMGAYDPDYQYEESRQTRGNDDDEYQQIVNNTYDRWDGGLAACFGQYFNDYFKETAIGWVTGVNCIYNINKTLASRKDTHSMAAYCFVVNVVSSALACTGTAITIGTGPAGYLVSGIVNTVWNAAQYIGSVGGCLAVSKKYRHLLGVRSYDPNEMIGPWGPDDNAHYIQPIHNMAYTVTFENKPSATAPAHEVFVTDTLDATKYDLSTFGFSSFGWAENSYSVGGCQTQEFTRDIIYNVKGQDILVRVSGQYDATAGIARWSFVSLKKNGEEIDDPDLGFLLPNNDNRDGEGFVSFSIEHKKNPKSGATVSNKATIVFDANAPIVTNTYVNTFDTDYPTSKITKVEEKDGQLVVTLQGSDATSGIDHYTLYAFKNGSEEAEVLAANVTSTQVTVACEPATKYGLCIIATDRVGWHEAKGIKVEQTFTTGGTAPTITYALNVPAAGYATFFDSQNAYSMPAGLKASTVSAISGGRLSYQGISGSIVPKNTAVLIEASKKQAATYTLTSTAADGSAVGTNLLHGSDNATTTAAAGDNLYYKLSYGAAGSAQANSFGWYWGAQNGTPFQIEAHRAWLAIPKGSGARAYLIDGSETDINALLTDDGQYTMNDVYDLQGRRIQRSTLKPGIYLKNGKKIVVK